MADRHDVDDRLAFAIADAVGGRTPDGMVRHSDGTGAKHIDLVRYNNVPFRGGVTFGTLGLSTFSIGGQTADTGPDLRVELVGATYARFRTYDNVLATCAFSVMDGAPVMPGQIYEGAVEPYFPGFELKHVLFTEPYLWDDAFTLVELGDTTVVWLQPVPITQRELDFAVAVGTDALIERFEEERIDAADMDRESVI
ncbi:suppressor of fused domain protein [Glycomyces rhizosphaerae]|uniref:Suppressor of fused domain protein n=1 Tax=Glycomyces rhizosphaerae TaxID=2054422 RepID=A0ABV7Q2D3_9ACTN